MIRIVTFFISTEYFSDGSRIQQCRLGGVIGRPSETLLPTSFQRT
ncbi:hypothetical protein [Neisseria arctica]|nr:hypothetical protein [Neisseria arctica]